MRRPSELAGRRAVGEIGEILPDSAIPRLHLFEFHDQSWFPAAFRGALTEWLRVLWDFSRAAEVVAPILAEAVRESQAREIVDLCSGGTGPMIPVQLKMESLGLVVPVLATDKYPDISAMAGLREKTGGRISGSLESFDVTSLPENLKGFRTLWNSFHHFTPAGAGQILRSACRGQQPIAIFEFTERSVPKVLSCFPASFISVFLLIAMMRTKSYSRLLGWWFFTWMIPLIPLTIAWDGLVSHLRSYTGRELLELIENSGCEGYNWKTGRVHAPRAGLDVSYLIGLPLPPAPDAPDLRSQ